MDKMINFKAAISTKELLQIEEMAKVIWHEHYTPIIGTEQVVCMLDKFQSIASMSTQIKSGYQYFLINQAKIPVGYLSFIKRDEELFLSKIYILKELRGRGIGKKALKFIDTQAKENHCKKISLTVNRNNLNSIKAYERAGFQNTGEQIQDIGHGYVMDDYIMEKFL